MGLSESTARQARGQGRGTEKTPADGNVGSTQQQKQEGEKVEEAGREYVHKEPVGVVVIGLGQRMVTLLRFLLIQHGGGLHYVPKDHQKVGLIEIRAFCDESPDAIQQGVDHLRWLTTDLDLGQVPTFTSHEELFAADLDYSWVLIGSKNYLHKVHCMAAFEHGKHVFCEKPLATTLQDCVDIREAWQASGKLFSTGFVLRHAPFYRKIKEILDSGKLGRIVSVEANETLMPAHGGYIMRNWRRHREQTGPHILEKCCHDIDILNWMLDSLPARVASFAGLDIFVPENKPNPSVGRAYRMWSAWEDVDPFESDKDTEDNQVVIMEYQNKVRVTFHTNCNSSLPERSLRIFGVKGTLIGDLLKGKIKICLVENDIVQAIRFGSADMHGGADEVIVDDLVRSIDEETLPAASGEEGFRSAVVCLVIDQARASGQVESLEHVWPRFGITDHHSA
jgi:predicted dehydrogenase